MSMKMHDDEFEINSALAHQLVLNQFPQWADLPLQLIEPAGTDNAMYKFGRDMVIRMPRTKTAALNIEKECSWLPKLEPFLPIAIPKLIARGRPETIYPLPWLICGWLDGKNPTADGMLDYHQAALDLGNFVVSMQNIPLSNGPRCNRGLPLMVRDNETREAIILLRDFYDEAVLTKLWDEALSIPVWTEHPRWIHGDLHAGNLLAHHGRVSAVVDFGSVGVGDPACDLMVAWTLLTPPTREFFRGVVQPDDSTWARARGWALTFGMVAYPYYRMSNPLFAHVAKRAIDEVLADYETNVTRII